MSTKLIVCGSRRMKDYSRVSTCIDETIRNDVFINSPIREIVSSGEKGVPMMSKLYASENKYKYTEFKTNYRSKYDRLAPLARNREMVAYGDALLALWDGINDDTQHMVQCMKKEGKLVHSYIHSKL